MVFKRRQSRQLKTDAREAHLIDRGVFETPPTCIEVAFENVQDGLDLPSVISIWSIS